MPPFVVAILVCFCMVVGLLHWGRGGDLRTQAQTAADAAALGAVAEIRDRALQSLTQAFLPYAGYSEETTPEAAKRYAKLNDATLTSVDHRDFFGHTAVTKVKTDGTLRGIFDKLRGGRGTAKAIATVEFPICNLVFGGSLGPDDPPNLIGTTCNGTFIPIGADPNRYIRLFKIYLVAKEPPKCGLGALGSFGSGDTVQPVLDINPSSPFGPRNGGQHNGTDYPGGGEGQPIFAFADGVVVRSGPADGFGQWIVIDHNLGGKRVSSVYGHMWPDDLLVRAGQQVKAGQPIARVGNNGHSTGPHLHFELWEGGRFGGRPVDPHPHVQSAKPAKGGGAGAAAAAAALATNTGGAVCLGGPGGPVTGDAGSAKLCATAAKAAGFTGRALVLITAIGLAESSCRPDATNSNTNGSTDYGLFQVNKPVHPEPIECLMDPSCNAKAAFRISSGGTNFYPWCTYEAPACGGNGNGTYRQHIPLAEKTVAALGSKSA